MDQSRPKTVVLPTLAQCRLVLCCFVRRLRPLELPSVESVFFVFFVVSPFAKTTCPIS